MFKDKLLMNQLILVVLCFPVFYLIGLVFDPFVAFVTAMVSYWLMIVISVLYLKKKKIYTISRVKVGLKLPSNFLVSTISLIPAIAVFFIAFLPILDSLNSSILVTVVVIALMNGFIEKVFWRGIVIDIYKDRISMIVYSTLLFTVFHFVFLFLPITYDDGALNLVGGSLFMEMQT